MAKKKVLLRDFTQIYQIGDKHVQGGTLVELDDKELKTHKDIILAELKEEKKVEKKSAKKYTEKELFDMVKAEQVAILEKLGLKPARLEKDRVKQILEAQK